MTGTIRQLIGPVQSGVLLALLTVASVVPLRAEVESTKAADESPMAYRRIYVPADNPQVWPLEGEKFLPVETQDFEAWVAAANRGAVLGPPAAAITEAVYRARLEGNRLVDGQGQWTIAFAGGGPALVPFGPTSLAIREPHWNDDAVAPMRLGAWGRSGGMASVLGLEATRSGIVTFQWSVPAHAAGEQVFDWRLPPSTTTRVLLDLPVEKRPVWDGGVVIRTERLPPIAGAADDPARARPAEAAPSRDWQRWELIAGPDAQSALRIVDAKAGSASAAPSPTATMSESLSYEVTPRGLIVEVEWRLEDTTAPRRQLVVPLSAGVQLVSATVDGRETTWRLAADERETGARAIIELPVPAADRARTVSLRAWQPLVKDSAWQLPKLRPDDVFWAAGTIRIVVDPLLELRSLETSGCIQSDVRLSTAGGKEAETISFTQFSPTSRVELLVDSREPQGLARVGTSLVVGNADVTGRSVTRLDVARGSLHRLTGELPAGWIVDAVESAPGEVLGEWYVEERDGKQQIEIRLTDAVGPGRPVAVTITGRLQPASLNGPLSAATLRMVRWRNASLARQIMTVQTVEPYVVESVGELPVIAVEALTEEERALLPEGAIGPFYDLRDVADAAAVRLATKKGQFAGEIWLDATLSGDELRQTYHLVSRPQAGRVDQVLVFAPEKIDGDIRWREKSSDTALNAERIDARDPRREHFPDEGELWLLHLPRPQAGSVEIEATVTMHWKSGMSVPLMSLPEATNQHGRVFLSIDPQRTPEVEATNLLAIPPPNESHMGADRDTGTRLWAAYRYEPADCHNSARRPRLRLTPAANNAVPSPLVASRFDLESFYSASGEGAHRATYHLQNERGETGEFRLPVGARLTSAEVDGRLLELASPPGDSESFNVKLPIQAATVSLAFTTSQPPLTQGSRLEPPHLAGDLPVLSGEWKIWLPAEYIALETNAVGGDGGANWRERLFGPIGRPAGQLPFNPFHADVWSGLLTGWAEETPLRDPTSDKLSNSTQRQGASAEAEVAGKIGLGGGLRSSELSTERDGWRAYRRIFVAGLPEPIVIAHPPATIAWTASIFLLALLGGSWLRRCRDLFIGTAAIAAILCFTLSPVYSPFATGAFLGLLASLAVRWPRRGDPDDAPTRTWTRLATAGASSLVMVLMLFNLAKAQPTNDTTTAPPANVPANIYRVLIPIDAARRPVGTRIHVSEPLFKRLNAESESSASDANQWLLRHTAVQGELRRSPDGGEDVVAGQWSVTLDIETLFRNTTIHLPFERDQAEWPATAQVDGIPLPLEWNADGRSCTLHLAEPGVYQLNVSFIPRMRDVAGKNQVELSLPPWRGGEIALRRPAHMQGLEIEGASLQPGDERSSAERHGELNESGRLVLRWPQSETRTESKEVRITELRWLWIGEAGVEMDVKYVTPRDARLPQSLIISADPQWALLTDESSIGDVNVTAEAGGRQRIVVSLTPESQARGEATLRWRLVDSPLLGRLRLPPMELTSTLPASSWLAISSNSGVECEIVDAAGVPAETGEEFLAMWGDEELELPPIVLGRVATVSGLVVGTRPRTAESALDGLLQVAAGKDAFRLQYQAEVVPGSVHGFQFSVVVPASLAIDQIGVVAADGPISVRWARPAPGRVNVFYSRQLTEPYRITLTGHVLRENTESCPLPRIAAAVQSAAMERVHVYREEGVLVDVEGPANVDDAATDPPPAGWSSRLVGKYQVDSSTANQVQLAIKPNHPETVGETLTTLSHEDSQWWATFSARLAIKQGKLDTLWLRAPRSWTGPFDIHPAGTNVSVTAATDGSGNVLALRLPETIDAGEVLTLEVRGPLSDSGATVSVPVIASESPAEWKTYLSVPANDATQEMAWTTEGVRSAETPGDLRPSRAISLPAKTFLATGSSYRVSLAPPQEAQQTASVRLVDTSVVRGQSGNQLIATRFVVAPQGLAGVELQFPKNQQLVSANLDGQPARLQRLDDQRWVVSLGGPNLPQILDVVSRDDSHAAIATRHIVLQRPSLSAGGKPLPAEMSLWTFGQRRIIGPPRARGASIVGAVEQAGLRLDRLTSIAEAATPTAMGLPVPDGYNWFRGWSQLLDDAQVAARNTSATDNSGAASQVARSSSENLAPTIARIANWNERCNEVLGWPHMGPPGADSQRRPWPPAVDGIDGWVHCVADGGAEQTSVELSREDVPFRFGWLLGILGIGSGAVATVWLANQEVVRDVLHRWPHAAVVLAGLVWWAWLWPSWLGLVIVAASLVLLFRTGWPGHSLREDASTVVRVVRPR